MRGTGNKTYPNGEQVKHEASMTRESLERQAISNAVILAFETGTQRASDGSARPRLTTEDCEHIAQTAHDAMSKAKLGAYGVRTIHGGKM